MTDIRLPDILATDFRVLKLLHEIHRENVQGQGLQGMKNLTLAMLSPLQLQAYPHKPSKNLSFITTVDRARGILNRLLEAGLVYRWNAKSEKYFISEAGYGLVSLRS